MDDLVPRHRDPGRVRTSADATAARRSTRFHPGLEGLRGLAVFGVLLFHGGFSWATGGFLGVSTFFTLSGFLITSLLLREHAQTGTISLRKFWGRRFRRLMPASLVCLAGVAVLFATLVATNAQLEGLRADIVACLAYVANWQFIATGQSYEQIFTAPSPVLHFWSLAIEEQFYVLFPLLMSFLLVRWAARRTVLLWVLGGLAVASTLEMALLFNPDDTSRVYYGTDTRAAELLAGAVLAVLVADRTLLPRAWRSLALVMGSAALLIVVWLWHAAAQTDAWLYRGGFAIYALLSCSVVIAATQPGVVKNILSVPVLRWLGRISYAAYLFHWPIFLWLSPESTGWNLWVLFVVRLAITFGLAELSLRLIEAPVRERKILTGWQPFVIAPLAIALVVGVTVLSTRDVAPDRTQLAFNSDGVPGVEAITGTSTITATPTTAGQDQPPVTQPAGPVTALLFGDSVAWTLAGDVPRWSETHPEVIFANGAKPGCSIGVGGYVGAMNDRRATFPECDSRLETWPEMLGEPGQVKYVVILSCLYDVADRQIPGDTVWRAAGDPVMDDWLRLSIDNTVATMSTKGAKIIWLTCPYVDPQYTSFYKYPGPYAEADPARVDRWNDLIRSAGAQNPNMEVLELGAYLETLWPGGQLDRDKRPDGVHFTFDSAGDVLDWLGPQLTSGQL